MIKYSLKLDDNGHFVTSRDTLIHQMIMYIVSFMSIIQNGVYNPTTLKTVGLNLVRAQDN